MKTQNHSNCLEIIVDLNAYIDGELDAALCAHLEAHLNDCNNCRVVFNTLKKTIELCQKGIKKTAIPQDVKSRLIDLINVEEDV